MGALFKEVKIKHIWPYTVRCSKTFNGHWVKSVRDDVRDRSLQKDGRFYTLVKYPDYSLEGWSLRGQEVTQ